MKQAHGFLVASPDLPTLEGALSVFSWSPTPPPDSTHHVRQHHKMTVPETTHPLNLENVLKNREEEREKKANSVTIKKATDSKHYIRGR